MKTTFVVVLAAFLAAPVLSPVARAADAPQTIAGEVLDLSCFAMEGAKGKDHAACAKKCLAGGAPAGLLADDGTVYVLVDDHKNKKEFAKLKKLGGEKAKVTGTVAKQGNLTALVVSKVEKG